MEDAHTSGYIYYMIQKLPENILEKLDLLYYGR